jgi:DNA-binding transcriptional MerR regulator
MGSNRGNAMAYTVKKLAKLSGISIRTLHHYDEIGLLKPAYTGDNHYRYYKEEQLLMLQQILFYRELGFPLNEIKRIILDSDFNKLSALSSHKEVLIKRLDQTTSLIKTIDKTISHLRGIEKMKDEELYYGFNSDKQKQYEKDLVSMGVVSQDEMKAYRKKAEKFTKADEEKFIQAGKEIHQALIDALSKKLDPASKEVQALMKRHHSWVGWNPTKEKYIGLSELYQTPEFSKFYQKLHPELLAYLVKAMVIFAEQELA